jgi:hypothetical protein
MFRQTDEVLSKEELDEITAEMKSAFAPIRKRVKALADRCNAQKNKLLAQREREVAMQLAQYREAEKKTIETQTEP